VAEPEKSRRDTCAFCDFQFGKGPRERERSEEHIIAKRFLEVIPQARGGRVLHQRQDPKTGEMKSWLAKGLEIPTKRVCAVCNTGWMNDLDTQALPYLKPMIQGTGKHLHEGGQTHVAAWASKVALAFHLVNPERDAPIDHYREIEVTKLPPRWTIVWLAAYEDLPRVGYQNGYLLRLDDADCHAATILIGHLIVQVFGHTGKEEMTWEGPAWDKALVRVWPYAASVVWPPKLVITEQHLGSLMERFIIGGTRAG
jgi:hypothetical protein